MWRAGDIGIRKGHSLDGSHVWKVKAVGGDTLKVIYYWPKGGLVDSDTESTVKISGARKLTTHERSELGL